MLLQSLPRRRAGPGKASSLNCSPSRRTTLRWLEHSCVGDPTGARAFNLSFKKGLEVARPSWCVRVSTP